MMSPEEIVKKRWLGFLIWQSIISTSSLFLYKTLILSPLTSSNLFSLFSFFSFLFFLLSLFLFSFSIFFLSSPHSHPSASPAQLTLGFFSVFIKSIIVGGPSDPSTVDFRRRARTSLGFLLFIILCGFSGFFSVFAVCGPSVPFDAARLLELGLRGLAFGVVYGMHYIYRERWVLTFPIIQRPLFFSLKMAIPSSLREALKLSTVAYVFSTVLMVFLPDEYKTESTVKLFIIREFTFFLGTSVVSFCWEFSHHLLQVLHTRRIIFAPPQGSAAAETNPSEHLLAALEQSTPRSLFQYLAFLDLCMVSESNVDAWRRAAFFEETGETYRQVISVCLRPLEQLTSKLCEGLEGRSADKPDLFSQQLSGPTDIHVDSTLHKAFNDFQLCAWCARTVAALTSCSRREDRFGVAQLTGCNAAVVSTLLSCLLIVEACMGKKTNPQSSQLLGPSNIRWATANTGRRDFIGKKRGGALHAKAYVMADVLRSCIYEIVSVFHDEMQRNAKAGILDKDWIIKSKPLYGTRDILVHKLSLFIDFCAT